MDYDWEVDDSPCSVKWVVGLTVTTLFYENLLFSILEEKKLIKWCQAAFFVGRYQKCMLNSYYY